MTTAWQLSAMPEIAPERLVRFGRVRRSITIAVVEDDRGYCVEARCKRRVVARIAVGWRDVGFDARVRAAIERAHAEATATMLDGL